MLHVKKYIRQNRFTERADPLIVGTELCQQREQSLQALTELSFNCLSNFTEDRPTVIDVAKQLRKIYKSTG